MLHDSSENVPGWAGRKMLCGWLIGSEGAATAWIRLLEDADIDDPERWALMLKAGLIRGMVASDIGLATDYLYDLANDGRSAERRSFLGDIARDQLKELGFDAALS